MRVALVAGMLAGLAVAAPVARAQEALPEPRVVAVYGQPGHPDLGELGRGSPVWAAARAAARAARLREPLRPATPALELVASVAQRTPGADRAYRRRLPDALIARYLRAARAAGVALLLDVQPGRAAWAEELEAWEPWLREPDVHLALDPEWVTRPHERPGRRAGSIDAADVDGIAAWLDAVAERERLPRKLLVVHHFRAGMIRDPQLLAPAPPRVRLVADFDGIGPPRPKTRRYRAFAAGFAPGVGHGLMLFLRRDGVLLRPPDLLALTPSPDFVGYQ